jgi:branched-chain amino acid transport system ATP-binding protein
LSLFEIEDLWVYYGKAVAIQGVSINLDEGEALAVIGPNGAGKTTLLKSIAGLVPSEGSIRFQGKETSSLAPFEIARRRIILCPEGRKLFPELSVRQNLVMGGYVRKDGPQLRQDMERAYELFPVLKARQGQVARSLSGGEQQMLAIARSLMARPLLFMLDEPSMGLALLVKESISESIREINREGVTLLLVEQDVNLALDVVSRVYLLENGQVQIEGSSEEVGSHPHIKKAYLGIS